MRQSTQYSPHLIESIITKALPPNAAPIVELAKESGIPYSTIYTWVSMSRKNRSKSNNNIPTRPKSQSAEAKFKAVMDTLNMTEEEKGAYCRQHGFYTHHLEEWKKLILEGLGATHTEKSQKIENQKTKIEIKKLQSDLRRKDKALAEVSALLILKKKADLLWGDNEDD